MSEALNKNKGRIRTVLGNIDAASLGHCQCHEHVFIARGRAFEVNPALCMDDFDKTLGELRLYRQSGGRALLDAQPVGCGRMARQLAKASSLSSVDIIASTGFHKLVFYRPDHWIHRYSAEALSELFASEITCGMYEDGDGGEPSVRSGICAGVIKAALGDCGIAGRYGALFCAAADASLKTGAPVLIHVDKGADALRAAEFFDKKGLGADRLIFCHMDRAEKDLSVHKELACAGAFLEYDTIARPKYHSDEEEIKIFAKMAEEGLAWKLLFGLDTTNERLRGYGGAIGLDYILKAFIPQLKSAGFDSRAIDMISIGNPQKALSIR